MHAYGCLCPFLFPHHNGMPIKSVSGSIPKTQDKKSCYKNKANSQNLCPKKATFLNQLSKELSQR